MTLTPATRRPASGAADAPLRVVVLDEIDALARERGSVAGDETGVRDSVTAQLLSCLDGVDDAGNLVVLATTNRPDLLDPALLRPGRLEVRVEVSVETNHGISDRTNKP